MFHQAGGYGYGYGQSRKGPVVLCNPALLADWVVYIAGDQKSWREREHFGLFVTRVEMQYKMDISGSLISCHVFFFSPQDFAEDSQILKFFSPSPS